MQDRRAVIYLQCTAGKAEKIRQAARTERQAKEKEFGRVALCLA